MGDAEAPVDADVEAKVVDTTVYDDEQLDRMWVEYQDHSKFFSHLEVADGGGLDEVAELKGMSRYVSAVMAIIFVAMNGYYIIFLNIPLVACSTEQNSTWECPELFMVTGRLGVPQPWPARIVGGFEMLWFLILMFQFVYQVYVACTAEHPCETWTAVQTMAWDITPSLASTSAMKLLSNVAPKVLVPKLMETVNQIDWDAEGILTLLQFLVLRVIAGYVGFESFLYKLQLVGNSFIAAMDDGGVFNAATLAISFLNQMLAIVQVSMFTKERVFAFIFAGEDGVLGKEEAATREAFESMLAREIWTSLGGINAIAAYLTYSDTDFQKLVLDEVDPAKKKLRSGDLQLSTVS
jgi:hypothetical protein